MGELIIPPAAFLSKERQWFPLKARNSSDEDITGDICLQFALTAYQIIDDEDSF